VFLLCEAMSMPNADRKRDKLIQPLMGDVKRATMQSGRVSAELWPQFGHVREN
jgi:hypothetical protein